MVASESKDKVVEEKAVPRTRVVGPLKTSDPMLNELAPKLEITLPLPVPMLTLAGPGDDNGDGPGNKK